MKRLFAITLALFLSASLALAQSAPQLASTLKSIPPARGILGEHAMVVAQERIATRIGVEILDRGGNAVDAAVAVGFALAVTYPRAGNIGGGGFMVVHLAHDNRNIAIDYRETAPAAATPTMFLDAQGNPDPAKSRDSGLSVGVPGTVAGLALAHQKYGSGTLSLAELLRPAIRLAEQGFRVQDDLADSMPRAVKRLARWPSTVGVLLKNGGQPLEAGDRLIQFDLADTLQAIANQGPDAFYQGAIAEKIAAAVQKAGGVMTADDLKNYRAVERPVVRGSYRGYDIVSMPPPSSGGVHLIEMLNILEAYDLAKLGRGDEALHIFTEAMKRAYADRAVYMGDPD
ncbi:MAG: gamma-glutamyltransferase, partial [Pseudolabrys sp.]|nr:gamma-glutamyltransferase [Pseudolabrys sp.]